MACKTTTMIGRTSASDSATIAMAFLSSLKSPMTPSTKLAAQAMIASAQNPEMKTAIVASDTAISAPPPRPNLASRGEGFWRSCIFGKTVCQTRFKKRWFSRFFKVDRSCRSFEFGRAAYFTAACIGDSQARPSSRTTRESSALFMK